jgi:hypothetical protein
VNGTSRSGSGFSTIMQRLTWTLSRTRSYWLENESTTAANVVSAEARGPEWGATLRYLSRACFERVVEHRLSEPEDTA